MQRLAAIALLTWKAAFRFRLFWVLAGLLLLSVVVLPLLLKDDGTARGFTQILLTYTLGLLTTLLGFSTLWLACGTMARDIEECQIQMLAVKPVARWQIWLGKWIGILLLNGCLLAISGASIYGLLHWRTRQMEKDLAQARLQKNERRANHLETQLKILREEIFVARASIKEPPTDLEREIQERFKQRLKETPVPREEYPGLLKIIREQSKAPHQTVNPGHLRRWKFDFGLKKALLRDQPLFLRFKFYTAQTNNAGVYLGRWVFGKPGVAERQVLDLPSPAGAFQEFEIPGNLIDADGQLVIDFENFNRTALIFPLDEGLEILYRDGGFGLNFARGLGLIFSWLALLAAVGLSAASLMSFPVAAFVSASLLVVVLSGGTLAAVVEQGGVGEADHETGEVKRSPLDVVMIPFYTGLSEVVNMIKGFSPIDSLSTGRSITWGQLGWAWVEMGVVMCGVIGGFGMVILTRRELATAQGKA